MTTIKLYKSVLSARILIRLMLVSASVAKKNAISNETNSVLPVLIWAFLISKSTINNRLIEPLRAICEIGSACLIPDT